MGIYIPNMSKPKSCWECRLMDGEANCLVIDEGISYKQEGILDDCPLIEIGDIQYKAFLEFNEKLIKKLEEHFLHGERNK